MQTADTIFAIASGTSRAAILVARLSGPATRSVVKSLAGRIPPPREAALMTFTDPASGEPIDRGLLLFFPAPQSFTGEDCAEFHLHGSRAVISAILAALGRLEGTRPAEPGEFTRRALLNGKMDLAQIEGLGDLIEAETDWQRRQALRQMNGALSQKVALWRQNLLEAAALIEAEIDFSEEADVPEKTSSRIGSCLASVLSDLEHELDRGHVGEIIRDGLTILIAGPPNAGKSTLLNALARRDVAIVSPEPGTTRDLIEVHLDLKGCAVTLIDTAGLRDAASTIEQLGMDRARAKAREADLILWLSEASAPIEPLRDLSEAEVWSLYTKSDLYEGRRCENRPGLWLSAETGENLDLLIERISSFANTLIGDGSGGLVTRERHRRAFADAAAALKHILGNLDEPVEFLAEDLRIALHSLQRLTGAVDVEDILGEIFSRFCIGK
jgi:tRNA modification GTPase